MNSQPKEHYSDSYITLKSVLLFAVLTILNISLFVFMVFENQMDLIAKNAELESKDKGLIIKMRVEDIIAGGRAAGALRRFNVSAPQTLVYPQSDLRSEAVDTLQKGAMVMVDHEIADWYRILYRQDRSGWVMAHTLARYPPAWERERLDVQDIQLILEVLDHEGIQDFSVFLESGYILADSRGRKDQNGSLEEQRLIKKAIFKNSFENLAFYHEVNKSKRAVDLYIPLYYGPNRLFVLKPRIAMHYVWQQTGVLYRQCILIGLLVLLVHVLFVWANHRFIILPMVRERTTALEAKNQQIRAAKDELQETYNKLNETHTIIQRELDKARAFQLSIIPQKMPDIPGYRLNIVYIPAMKVGGDFYDFYTLDKEKMGFIIADAAGHGISAAFVASMSKTIFTHHAHKNASTSTMLQKANRDLCTSLSAINSLTAFYMILHTPTGRLAYTRAGHPAPILYRAESGLLQELESKGIILGIWDEGPFEEKKVQIQKGHRLILFTDGLVEAADPDDNIYGLEALMKVLLEVGGRSGKEISDAVMADLNRFAQDCPYEDDIALIVLERN
jgi:serine phosphatase RsbU (regulator of sigma subunit)